MIFESASASGGEGEYYSNARWYDPTLGRFLTEDPARAGINWFAYVDNNPLAYIDPTGLEPQGLNLWQKIGLFFKEREQLETVTKRHNELKSLNRKPGLAPEETKAAKVEIQKEFRDANKELDLKYKTLFSVPETPTLDVSSERTPKTAENIKTAQEAGQPTVLTYDPDPAKSDKRRDQALKASGLEPKADPWRDEYPFAKTAEGGAGAQVSYVPAKEQQKQGGELNAFIVRNNLKAGEPFYVDVK